MLSRRFLEISAWTPDILASLEFYQALGFTQGQVGDSWDHPYAVVGDGRLCLGLHQHADPFGSLAGPFALTPTYIQPDLARHVDGLVRAGWTVDILHLDEGQLHRACLVNPLGQRIALVEARTHSPAGSAAEGLCGWFSCLGYPVHSPGGATGGATAAWEALGYVALGTPSPFEVLSFTSDGLGITFYRTRTFRQPVLVFANGDMPGRLARIGATGITPGDGLPDTLDPVRNAVLVAPEGTILLLTADDSAEGPDG